MINTTHRGEPMSITAARSILTGKVPLFGGKVLIHKDETNEPWTFRVFDPAEEVRFLSDQTRRNNLHPEGLTFAEEQALSRKALSHEGREAARKVYAAAANEAVNALLSYSQHNPFHSGRLRARVCQAIREELVALVKEWEALRID